MSTRTDFNIRASEAFFNLPDVSNINDQRFIISKTQWFGQVFLSKSAELQKIFFLCDNTEGLEIIVHKATITTSSNGQTIYTPGQIVASLIHEIDGPSPFQKLPSESGDLAAWHYPNWLATPQTADDNEEFYIIVFKTDTDKTPSLYFTFEYRLSVFPQIIGWDGTNWSNSNIDTKIIGDIQVGAIVSGYIGNEVNENTVLDSGTSIIGGRDTARRGHPVFMMVENLSSQNDKVALNFSLIPPGNTNNGTTEETAQAMMKWYYFSPGTLPASKNFDLVNSRKNAELNALTHFAVYMQPDRLSPFADTHMPESELDLKADTIGFVPIYEGSSINKRYLQDSTDRFSTEFWANFSTERDLVLSGSDRDADASTNPNFVDLTMENPNGEVDVLKKITLTDSVLEGTSTEKEVIRGFNKSDFFNNKYIFFSEKTIEDLDLTDPTSLPDTPGKLIAYVADSSFSSFDKKTIEFADSTPSTLGFDTGGVVSTYIVGVSDTTCQKINGVDTLLILFKTFVSTTGTLGEDPVSFFDIGYYQGDLSEDTITIQLINHEKTAETLPANGFFIDSVFGLFGNGLTGGSSILEEDSNSMFITPNNGDSIYFTANSDYSSTALIGGCGIWKINLTDVLSSDYEAERLKPNNLSDVSSLTLILPFDIEPEQTGIADFNDVRITSVLYDGNTTYLGVRGQTLWVGIFGNLLTSQQMAKVYKTDDFQTFEQLIGSELMVVDGGPPATVTGDFPDYIKPFVARENLFQFFAIDPDTEIAFFGLSGSFSAGDSITIGAETAVVVEVITSEEDPTEGKLVVSGLTGLPTALTTITGPTGTATNRQPFGLAERIINNDVKFMHKVGDILHVWICPHFYDAKNTPMHLAVNVQTKEVRVLREFPIEDEGDSDYSSLPKISDLDKFPRSKSLRWIEGGSVSGNNIYIYGADRLTSETEGPTGDIVSTGASAVPVAHSYPSEYSARWIMYDDRTINKAFEKYDDEDFFIIGPAILSSIEFSGTGANDLSIVGTPDEISEDFPYLIEIDSVWNQSSRIAYSGSGSAGNDITVEGDSIPTGEFDIVIFISAFLGTDRFTWSLNGVTQTSQVDTPLSTSFISLVATEGPFIGSTGVKVKWDSVIFHGLSSTWTFNTKDSFKWSKDGGETFEAEDILITASALTDIDNGIDASFAFNAGHSLGDQWEFSLSENFRLGFKLRDKGVYHGKTIVPFDHDETSPLFSKYPAISPDLDSLTDGSGDLENPRVGMYCHLVSYGSEKTNGIINEESNILSNNITTGGVNYLSVNNDEKGIQLFKTYGIKELPENWGRSLKLEDGSSSDLRNYEFANLDLASFERSIAGEETFKNSAKRVEVLNPNNVLILSEMKTSKDRGSGDFINITDEFPDRTLFVLNSSLLKAQHLSMFYRFKFSGTDADDLLNLSDPDTSETILTVRGAETLEKLFTDPNLNIDIPLAQEVSSEQSNRVLIRKTFPTDIESNFVRLESPSLYDDLTLQIKNLRFYDITTSNPEPVTAIKKVAINGIVDSEITDPENVIDNGVVLSPGGEIIIDFIKPIYINEVNFIAQYMANDLTGLERSEFEFTAIKNIEKRTIGDDLVGPDDWVQLGQNVFYGDRDNEALIKKENIASYIQTLRIRTLTGVSLRLKDLIIKGFASDSSDQIQSSGDINEPENILVDDLEGLLGLNIPDNQSAAFATFNSNNSYVEFDLGETIPITRISMNIAGEEETNTRTIQVDIWDGTTMSSGEPEFDNVFTGPVPNYEFSIVRWTPRTKERSRNVEIEFLDSAAPYTPDPLLTDSNIGQLLLDFNNLSNNSGLLDRSGLAGWSFKPSIFRDRSITVSSSQGRFETGTDEDYIDAEADGLIIINAQMDEDGPFSEDVNSNALGLLENSLNVDFPSRNVRRVKITLKNQRSGDASIKINGLRVFTTLVDNEGNSQTPVSTATWNIRLGTIVSTEN